MRTIKSACLALVALFVSTAAGALVVEDVTVVSPERSAPLPHAYVVIDNGKIISVSTEIPTVTAGQTINGKGKFLIPGLIDSHVHLASVAGMSPLLAKKHAQLTREYNQQLPRSYLYYGYTTVIDLSVTDRKFINDLKSKEVAPEIFDCDGALIIANGYPMHYAPATQRFKIFDNFVYDARQAKKIPSQYSPAEHSPAFLVDKVKKAGAVCVKTFYEPGFGKEINLPTPDRATLDKIAKESRRQGLPLMVHANSFAAQSFVVSSPIDIVAHGMWSWGPYSSNSGLPEPIRAVLDTIIAKKIGYQPTFQVIAGLKGLFTAEYLDDPRLAEVAPASLIKWFRTKEGAWFADLLAADENVPREKLPRIYDRLLDHDKSVVRYLAAHDARLLFGSDTPSAPTYANVPGLNGYLEMKNWSAAGVPLPKLLKAATLDNAKAFGLDDRYGTIESNKNANLVLLNANPLDSVKAYEAIDTVILKGKPLARSSLSARATN